MHLPQVSTWCTFSLLFLIKEKKLKTTPESSPNYINERRTSVTASALFPARVETRVREGFVEGVGIDPKGEPIDPTPGRRSPKHISLKKNQEKKKNFSLFPPVFVSFRDLYFSSFAVVARFMARSFLNCLKTNLRNTQTIDLTMTGTSFSQEDTERKRDNQTHDTHQRTLFCGLFLTFLYFLPRK